MIEIINPGLLSIIVDKGRFGYARAGIPSSSALDQYAFRALNALLGNNPDTPVIEVIGNNFGIKIHIDTMCAITGAKVVAQISDADLKPWSSVRVAKGSILKIKGVTEGFRFYIGFSGAMDIIKTIGSCSTNLECGFGGFHGRSLKKGDKINLIKTGTGDEDFVSEEFIPPMHPPHTLHVLDGPEMEYFTSGSVKNIFHKDCCAAFTVSARSNRSGIRLEGAPLSFKKNKDRSIISEGIMPGTVQVPGDGQPIIVLHERTIGGYARPWIISKADLDLLAHLRPKDKVIFESISLKKAKDLWNKKLRKYYNNLIFKVK